MPFERIRTTYKQLGALDGSLYYLSLLLDKGSVGRPTSPVLPGCPTHP
jgi:hypothetical protein